jgi:hypothetical protein
VTDRQKHFPRRTRAKKGRQFIATSVNLTPAQLEQLYAESESRSVPIAQIGREAFAEYFARRGKAGA